jgi:hypothetical protein
MARKIYLAMVCIALAATAAAAQQAPVPSPRHFKVVFENAKVRVLHVYMNAKDKTEPHEMRDAVAVPLVDYDVKLIEANGATHQGVRKAGEPTWVPGSVRVAEAGDKPVESIVVELKGKPSGSNAAGK